VVLIVIFFLVLYIVKPFEVMRSTSKEIIRISTEEEDLRDYSTLVDDAYFNLTRTDEVGLLAADYYDIVCLLHYGAIEKKEAPKYPLNPFHLSETEVRKIVAPTTGSDQPVATRAVTSADLIELMKVRESSSTALTSVVNDDRIYTSSLVVVEEEEEEEGVLHLHHLYRDEISSSKMRSYRSVLLSDSEIDSSSGGRAPSGINGLQLSPPSLHDISIEEGGYMVMPSSTDDDDHRDLFVHRVATTAVTAEQHRTTLSLASRLSAIKGRMRAVGTCTSIKSQLYMLSALLLLGLAITMIITVTLVDTEGQSWTDESGSNLGEDKTYYRSTYMLVLVIASHPL
jgi:hypothetical protein